MPKIGRSLPKSLSEAEVDSLLEAPRYPIRWGTATAPCSRCFMRPVCGFRTRQPQTQSGQSHPGVMRVVGKGNRERLIPLGEEAVRWLQQFMQGRASKYY